MMPPPLPPAPSPKDTREWILSVDAHTQTSGVILMNLDIEDGAVIGRSRIVHAVPRSRLDAVEKDLGEKRLEQMYRLQRILRALGQVDDRSGPEEFEAKIIAAVAAVERENGELRARRDELQRRVDALDEPWMDERGTAWMAPTAWAYAQACRVRDELKRELVVLREHWLPIETSNAGFHPSIPRLGMFCGCAECAAKRAKEPKEVPHAD